MSVIKLIRECPVCKNTTGQVLHNQSFILPENSPLPNSYNIVFCERCGFIFADTPANQAIYNEYYTRLSKYDDLNTASGGGVAPFDYERLDASAKVIQKFLTNNSATILDMGCANGGLLKALKNRDYHNIVGIDPSKACNKYVQFLGIPCIEGDIFSKSFHQIPHNFDCIILTHVIEHIYDLQEAVENISSKLNENGILYIEVPDASHYNDYYMVPYYYIDCEHINHFDANSLENLFCSGGFTQLETVDIDFKVNDSNKYPAVYSVFQKTKKTDTRIIKFSSRSKDSFIEFVNQSKSHNENNIVIQQLIQTQDPVYIWGAGQFTMRLLANSVLNKCNIQGFIDVDSNKQGKKIITLSIFPPEHLRDTKFAVVICSALHSSEIMRNLQELNVQSAIYTMK